MSVFYPGQLRVFSIHVAVCCKEVQPGEDPSVLTLFDRVFVRQEGQYPLCGYCKGKGNQPILKRKKKDLQAQALSS